MSVTSSEFMPASGTPFKIPVLYIAVLAGMTIFSCLALKSMGPAFMVFMLAMALMTPLLLRVERLLLLSWVIAYPIFYGFQILPIMYILLPLSLPGTLASLVRYGWVHRRLVFPLTLPLWLLLGGYLMNMTHFSHVLKPSWLLRDIGTVAVTLYLVALAWQWMMARPRFKKYLYHALMGMGLLNGVVILFQKILHVGVMEAGGATKFLRPMGLFSHPNPAGYDVLMAIVLGLYGYFTAESPKSRFFYAGTLMILLMACMMTMSKTSILQLLPLLGLWLMFLPGKLRLRIVGITALISFVLVAWSFLVDHGALWVSILQRFSKSDTLEIRQRYWTILSGHMNPASLFWGHGYRSTTQVLGVYNYQNVLFSSDLNTERGAWAIHPHNAYLKYIFEYGVWAIGMFVAYGLMLLRAGRNILKPALGVSRISRRLAQRQRLANLTVFSLLMVFFVEGMTEILGLDQLYALMYMSLGLCLMTVQAGWYAPGRLDSQDLDALETDLSESGSRLRREGLEPEASDIS